MPLSMMAKRLQHSSTAIQWNYTATFFNGYSVELQHNDLDSEKPMMQEHEEPAECFISHVIIYDLLISKLSNMVILLPWPCSFLMVHTHGFLAD